MGSWTHKETERVVTVRQRTDRILGDQNQEQPFQPPEHYGYMLQEDQS